MAKASKSKGKSTPKKAPSPGAPPAPTKAKASPVLDAIRPKLPLLGPDETNAYLSLFSDAQCEEWGGRTRSSAVYAEAEAWVPVLYKNLTRSPAAYPTYSLTRLAFLVWTIDRLGDAMEAAKGEHGVVKVAAKQVARRSVEADAARASLRAKLRTLAGGNADAHGELSDATLATRTPAELAEPLRALATLGDAWLARTDATARVLVAEVKLTKELVASARGAADALLAASGDKKVEGRLVAHDTPTVNRAEGRTLREMKVALDATTAAHARDAVVSQVAPGAGTRGVLRPAHHAAKGKAKPAAPAAGAPATPTPTPVTPP